MDTVTVLIRSRQFVFVPGQPGPESSHKPEKVQIGERVSNIEPVYPAQAAQKRMGGTVHLRATIGKDGAVESVRSISGPTLLIPAAIDAVQLWKYQPTLLEQQPIEMQEDITIEFRPLR
jgi:periplasmic protein TonB